ncbi:MAG: methyltransferase [Alphaproteobacteria bacterium]|nr:methyltransferase [Alphaproteobacteria bacterium]
MAKPPAAFTKDEFLGGRITVCQPAQGYRAAVDSVLLAAAAPAKPGQTVLELGCGAGVVFMCLAARVARLKVTGVDIQQDLAQLARQNAAGISSGACRIAKADVRRLPASIPAGGFDHVFANPPFHDAAGHSPSPRKSKNIANAGDDLAPWIKAAHVRLKHRAVFTIIFRADRLGEVLAAMEGKFGGIEVIPLWPRAGQAARRVIVRGRKDAKTPLVMHPGMVLHGAGSAFTPEAENVLRHAGSL